MFKTSTVKILCFPLRGGGGGGGKSKLYLNFLFLLEVRSQSLVIHFRASIIQPLKIRFQAGVIRVDRGGGKAMPPPPLLAHKEASPNRMCICKREKNTTNISSENFDMCTIIKAVIIQNFGDSEHNFK